MCDHVSRERQNLGSQTCCSLLTQPHDLWLSAAAFSGGVRVCLPACLLARGACVAACCCPLARGPCLCAFGAPGAIFDLLAFLALLVTGLFMGFKAMNAEPTVRVYYYINAYVCGVATFAYFAMLSGMGWETIMGCRQFFYVRCAPYLLCSQPCMHSLARAAARFLLQGLPAESGVRREA